MESGGELVKPFTLSTADIPGTSASMSHDTGQLLFRRHTPHIVQWIAMSNVPWTISEPQYGSKVSEV